MSNDVKTSTDSQIITLGCRLNIFESEVMRKYAQEQNLKNTIIINTCAVTNEAERQSRQAIRKAKRQNADKRIIVTGCSAQINPQIYKDMPEVDFVWGNYEKMQASSFNLANNNKVQVNDIMQIKETANHLIAGFDNKSRAFIEIQNGCDHRCTFCTIPYGRGNNRSNSIAAIVQQAKLLVQAGYQEIILTGVDITDYGKNLPNQPQLGDLCKRLLHNVPDLQRLRLSSLDPIEVDSSVFDLIGSESRLMPHFHISLQSGDDMILKRMKRRHLRKDVIEFCNKVRNLRKDVVFGADIICGFPTETDEMFSNTIKIVEECDLTFLHIFPYSIRKGTPAARMPQIPKQIGKERAKQLKLIGEKQKAKFFSSKIGKSVQILIEKDNYGHCEHFAPIQIKNAPQLTAGKIITANIIQSELNKLIATVDYS